MNDGGPAFPVPFGFTGGHKSTGPNDPIPNDPWINTANGMSLRDWFAGQALSHWTQIASECYKIADAMLAERAKQQ